jgi:glutathione S-transferase
MPLKLVIGNKNYSSWSLRAWLLLSAYDVSFETVRIPLFEDTTEIELARYTDAGKVPVLHDGDTVVWDSLAICEYISEQYLDGRGWPADTVKRAIARACSAEMHSGFSAIRTAMPMNCRATGRRVAITGEIEREVRRLDTLWSNLRRRYSVDGPWLFGGFSIADCMFAPVASRFATYGVELSDAGALYQQTLLDHPHVRRWYAQAADEKEIIEQAETGK